MPWRKTKNPYKIFVSEIMLQQTQVDRVIPKYQTFIKQFPSCIALAQTSLGEVLRTWQGLGYNRRAQMLHQCAQVIVAEHRGKMPSEYTALIALPGIGPYTAGAIMAFAFEQPAILIETNIRSVYLHHFFHNVTNVMDHELIPYIERTLNREKVREWYYALMDYGVYIKKTYGNPNTRSNHYAQQSPFKDSDRYIRGAILRYLTSHHSCTRAQLLRAISVEDIRIDAQLQKLQMEGMIALPTKNRYELPT